MRRVATRPSAPPADWVAVAGRLIPLGAASAHVFSRPAPPRPCMTLAALLIAAPPPAFSCDPPAVECRSQHAALGTQRSDAAKVSVTPPCVGAFRRSYDDRLWLFSRSWEPEDTNRYVWVGEVVMGRNIADRTKFVRKAVGRIQRGRICMLAQFAATTQIVGNQIVGNPTSSRFRGLTLTRNRLMLALPANSGATSTNVGRNWPVLCANLGRDWPDSARIRRNWGSVCFWHDLGPFGANLADLGAASTNPGRTYRIMA